MELRCFCLGKTFRPIPYIFPLKTRIHRPTLDYNLATLVGRDSNYNPPVTSPVLYHPGHIGSIIITKTVKNILTVHLKHCEWQLLLRASTHLSPASIGKPQPTHFVVNSSFQSGIFKIRMRIAYMVIKNKKHTWCGNV